MKGLFSSRQASLVKGIFQVHGTLLSQRQYKTYTHNHRITESAAETTDVFSVEYCEVSQRGLYPRNEWETRIRLNLRALLLSGSVPLKWKVSERRRAEAASEQEMRLQTIDLKAETGERGTRRHMETDRVGSLDISATQCKTQSTVRRQPGVDVGGFCKNWFI